MGTALEKLAELNRMTWVHGPWESPSQKGKRQGPPFYGCNSTDPYSAVGGMAADVVAAGLLRGLISTRNSTTPLMLLDRSLPRDVDYEPCTSSSIQMPLA